MTTPHSMTLFAPPVSSLCKKKSGRLESHWIPRSPEEGVIFPLVKGKLSLLLAPWFVAASF